jgi:nitrate/nitrite transporter NarK
MKNKRHRWKVRYSVLLMLWSCLLLSFLDRMVINVALPFISKEFNIDPAGQGLIVSLFFLGFAIFQVPCGLITERIGVRKIFSVTIAWRFIFSILTGVASSYPFLLVSRFLFGLGEACIPGAAIKSIATYFPRGERGTANAIKSTVNTLGPAIAIYVGAAVIQAYGWRTVFMAMGIPSILIGLIIWFRYKDEPSQHPKINKEDLFEIGIGTNQGYPKEDGEGNITYKQFLAKPILWQLSLIWFLFDLTFWGFTAWLPSYLINERGFSLMSTGIYGALPFIVGTVSMILGGYLSDRSGAKRKWVFIPNAFMGGLALYFMFYASSDMMLIFYQCVAAFFMFMALGAFVGWQINSIPVHIIAASSAIVNTAGQIAGVISPSVMGYLIQVSGGSYSSAFLFIIAAIIASGIVALTVQNKAVKVNQSFHASLED